MTPGLLIGAQDLKGHVACLGPEELPELACTSPGPRPELSLTGSCTGLAPSPPRQPVSPGLAPSAAGPARP